MDLFPDQYYHLFNRSNNNELVFKSEENYSYFLRKYLHYFQKDFDTIAYCLMPTHFHFLVMVNTKDTDGVRKDFGIFLGSYTKAINLRYHRHGSLFQKHTKAEHVDQEQYLITLLTYIHQNPLRAGLVRRLEDWPHSSFFDYAGLRSNTFLQTEPVKNYFPTVKDFRTFSNRLVENPENTSI